MTFIKWKTSFHNLSIRLVNYFIFVLFWIFVFFCFFGDLDYNLIGIGGTYFEVHSILNIILAFLIILIIRRILTRQRITRQWIKGITDIFKVPEHYFITIYIVYMAMLIPVVLSKYYSFSVNWPQDFAHQHNAIYNTTCGNPLRTCILPAFAPFENWNLLKDHYYFILLLIAPVYSLFKEGSFLLIFQTLVLPSAGIALYLFSVQRLNRWWALLIGCSYLWYILILNLPFCGPKPEYYAVAFLIWSIYLLEKKKIGWALLLLLLAGLCKGEVWIATASFGIYMIFKKYKLQGMIVTVVSIAIFLFLMVYLYYAYNLGASTTYQDVLLNKKELIKGIINLNLITNAKEEYFLNLFRYLSFLPLFSPVILLSAPFFMINLIFNDHYVTVATWHSALIIPFLFVAYVNGIRNILTKWKKSTLILCLLLGPTTIFYGLNSFQMKLLNPFLEQKLYSDIKPEVYRAFEASMEHIPKGSSIFTQYALLPNLSNRRDLYWNKTKSKLDEIDSEYIIYNSKLYPDRAFIGYLGREHILFEGLEECGRYEKIFQYKNFIVMASKDILEKKTFLISDFNRIDLEWEISPYNTKYKVFYIGKNKGVFLGVFFNGPEDEDGFIQLRYTKKLKVDLEKYRFFFIEYELEDSSIQTIEMAFGVDFTGDGSVDQYFRRLYVEQGKNRYEIDLFNLIKEGYPNKRNYYLVEFELYPQKSYCVYCKRPPPRHWHKTYLGKCGLVAKKQKK